MKDICPVIRIHLCGAFRVETGDGRDVSPRSAKACGLLALLAHSPRGQRTRVWLQDKLWSDRGREQGAASLRQALCRIRRDLGHCAGVVVATRGQVMLDLDRVEVAGPAGDRAGPEFLEGIDIRDAEFEAWLRAERAASAAPSGGGPARPPARRPCETAIKRCFWSRSPRLPARNGCSRICSSIPCKQAFRKP